MTLGLPGRRSTLWSTPKDLPWLLPSPCVKPATVIVSPCGNGCSTRSAPNTGDNQRSRIVACLESSVIDDYGGRIGLSTQQLRNLITLLVSDKFRAITGL